MITPLTAELREACHRLLNGGEAYEGEEDYYPVTVEWLLSIGFTTDHDTEVRSPLLDGDHRTFMLHYESMTVLPSYRTWGRWELTVPGCRQACPVQPETRGQLRALCAALGITLLPRPGGEGG